MRRFLPPLNLFWRLFLLLLLASLLPLLATWFYSREEIVVGAQRLAEAQLRTEAVRIAGRTDAWLQVNYESLVELADTVAIRSMAPELQRDALLSIATHQPWTVIAFTVGADGMSLARSDNLAPINYKDREYFKTAFSGQPIGQQVVISKTTNKPGWVVAVPIKDPTSRVVGVLAKTCGLNEITDQLANVKIGDTGRALLIAPDGKLVAMTGAAFDKELRDFSKHPAFVGREARGGVLRYSDENVATIAVVQAVRFGWIVAVQIDEAEVARPVRETDKAMLVVLLVAVLLAAAFAAVAAPRVAQPLLRLTAVAEEISRGRFEHELTEVERSDEIGALARAIERMTRSLQLAMDRLKPDK